MSVCVIILVMRKGKQHAEQKWDSYNFETVVAAKVRKRSLSTCIGQVYMKQALRNRALDRTANDSRKRKILLHYENINLATFLKN